MRPRIRARLARRPNPTRHTAPRAHGACLAAALAAAACMLLLLPPRDSYAAGDGLRGPFKNAMGPSPFYRNLSHEPHLAPSPRSDPAEKITFARTLRRFRSAVNRYAVHIRHFRAHRRFTSQPQQVPDESLKMFETLVTFEKPEYSFQLTPAFVQAIDAAEADAGNQQRHPSAAAPAPGGNGGSANAAPAPHGGAGQPGPP